MIDNDTVYQRRHKIQISSNQCNRQLDLLLSFVWNNSLEGEEWKEIRELQGRYFISNYGRVLSLCCNGYKLLKPFTCGDGYYYVDLRNNNLDIKSRVHRLVANSFVDNPQNKPIVHHKDCNRQNNKADNLEHLTPEEHLIAHRKIREKVKQLG